MRLFRALSLLLLVSTYVFAATPDRITGAIDSGQMVRLARNVHPKAQPESDRGVMDPGFKLGYMTLLTVPTASQQRALDRLLAEQLNPASANYHKWLTPEQYGDRFGLSPGDLNRITTWLKSQGFTVLSVARGRNWVTFSGTAGQVANAFQTEIHQYDMDGETHFANTTAPSVPAGLAGVISGFRGLHDFRMKPMGIRKRLTPDYFDAHFSSQFIAPGDIATIYDVKPLYTAGIDGTGQTVAVIGQTDVYLADLNDFRAGFGLSAINGCTTGASGLITACNTSNFQYVLVGTDPGAPFSGDLSESDLDLEWSGAVARNAKIIFVNSETANGVLDGFYHAIDNLTSPVISLSYGLCELGESPFIVADEAELQKANTEGITFVNSSGDVGAAACDRSTNSGTIPPNLAVKGLAVSWPASSQYVTGVGGTAVPFTDFTSTFWGTTNGADGGTALGYVPEQAWNDDAEIAAFCAANPTNTFCTRNGITSALTAQEAIGIGIGGGGASNCTTISGSTCTSGFPQPSWQTVTVPGQASARFVPDVSFLATPNFPGYIFCTPLSELGKTGSTSSCASGIATAIDTNLSIIGGTSASAPVFAGMVALLNQYLGNTSGMGNSNPMLYRLAAVAPTAFHDVTTGNNIVYCKAGTPTIQPVALQCPAAGSLGYSAGVGYDLATGLGSVDANNLAVAWKTPPDFTVGSSGAITVYAGQSGTATVTVNPINSFGQVVAFSCSGLPTGASCSFNPATVTPPGTATSTMTVQTTGSETAGTSSFSVVATAGVLSQVSHTASESLTVQEPDFTWTSSDLTHTVKAGQTSMVYHFTATPAVPTTFTTAVTFGCTFSPTDTTLSSSSCTFTPASIASGTSGATPVSLTITTKGPNTGTGSAVQHRADQRSPWLPLALPIAGMVMVGLVGRKVSKHSAVAGLCVSLALLGLLMACGGSNPPIMVTVTPASVNLFPNVAGANGWPVQQKLFSAAVANTSQTGVTWTISPASAGSIDASGNYTAPATVPNPATVTVTATSVADASKTGTATVNIQTPTTLTTFNVTVKATEAQTQKPFSVTLTVQ